MWKVAVSRRGGLQQVLSSSSLRASSSSTFGRRRALLLYNNSIRRSDDGHIRYDALSRKRPRSSTGVVSATATSSNSRGPVPFLPHLTFHHEEEKQKRDARILPPFQPAQNGTTTSRRCLTTSTTTTRQNTASPLPPETATSIQSTSSSRSTSPPPLKPRDVYEWLQLVSFSETELNQRFDDIVGERTTNDDHVMTLDQLRTFLETRLRSTSVESTQHPNGEERNSKAALPAATISTVTTNWTEEQEAWITQQSLACWAFLQPPLQESTVLGQLMSRQQFRQGLIDHASSLDMPKLVPLGLSMLLVGSSVGVTTPIMPFVVQSLELSAGQYGWVVSAFALSKMAGNIPSAVLVERHGRKPYLVYSMTAIAMGMGGIALADSFETLYLCRLGTGLGVAALSTAATLMVTDLSTPLNRASSFAPIMSAFAAGTALGPALGGYLGDVAGISTTFLGVGASFLGVAVLNSYLLEESKPTGKSILTDLPPSFPETININVSNHSTDDNQKNDATMKESFQLALGQWKPLWSEAPIRNVCLMNAAYWVALAGSQMTLLPLLLTSGEWSMTAWQVGQVYMGMSVVQVLGNPVFAKAVDRVGTVPGMVVGCGMIATGMAALPFCGAENDTLYMATALGTWAAGSTLLSTAPLAYVSDHVDDASRAQAIALLRTSGDVGFLVGASSMGALADAAGSLDLAMQSSAGFLVAATTWFAARSYLTIQEARQLSSLRTSLESPTTSGTDMSDPSAKEEQR